MAIGFILWSMASFDGQVFGICGKTIESLRRNVIIHLPMWLSGVCRITEKRSENKLIISMCGRSNTYYLFGGRDESSYALVQGITLAGVLFDEAALMPKSFVEQALARCSVQGSKFWFNCNPSSPSHWFYIDWVKRAQKGERNIIYLHFTMADNLSLAPEIKRRYDQQFEGVFHMRYIQGLWVQAEGAIYKRFGAEPKRYLTQIVTDGEEVMPPYTLKSQLLDITMGIDFGGTKSAHAFVATAHTKDYEVLIALKSERHFGEIDSNQLDALALKFAQEVERRYGHIACVYYDNAEPVLGRGIKRAFGAALPNTAVRPAIKSAVNSRIQALTRLMGAGRFFYTSDCETLKAALTEAVWNDKSVVKDERLDDGSTDIDSLDALEYAFERDIKRYIQ